MAPTKQLIYKGVVYHCERVVKVVNRDRTGVLELVAYCRNPLGLEEWPIVVLTGKSLNLTRDENGEVHTELVPFSAE
ncbi:MAG: hypothetical protein ABI670_20360 [Chloroflexota bacterium]